MRLPSLLGRGDIWPALSAVGCGRPLLGGEGCWRSFIVLLFGVEGCTCSLLNGNSPGVYMIAPCLLVYLEKVYVCTCTKGEMLNNTPNYVLA